MLLQCKKCCMAFSIPAISFPPHLPSSVWLIESCFSLLYISVHYMITAQSLVVECEATTVSNHIDIDCRTNRPPLTTFCFFNRGPKVDCMSLTSSSLHHISHYLCIVCVMWYNRFLPTGHQQGCVSSREPHSHCLCQR